MLAKNAMTFPLIKFTVNVIQVIAEAPAAEEGLEYSMRPLPVEVGSSPDVVVGITGLREGHSCRLIHTPK